MLGGRADGMAVPGYRAGATSRLRDGTSIRHKFFPSLHELRQVDAQKMQNGCACE